MAPFRKLILFAGCLALGLLAVELAARHKVRATPAGQALERYRPAGDHAVFLGSSLTDAAVEAPLLDSLLGPGLMSYNLALAGLSGSENYWLLLKGFILPRSRPRYLVVEAPGIPFLPPEGPFRLEGEGLRVESFRPEHLDWEGFLHLAGGMPAPAHVLSFLLHKTWPSFHLRHELQARLREKLIPREESPDAGGSPYRMVGDARERFTGYARAGLRRLESLPDPAAALRGHAAHFLDLAALARAHGISLVVLRPPLPPSDSLTARSPAFAAWQADFRGLCDSLGVAYLDLADPAACGAYGYTDGIHLDPAGARAFTRCVAAFLARRDP